MSYSIISTHRFEKELKRLVKKFPSLKSEYAGLVEDITENPEKGTFIGNSCFKIRLAIASKGSIPCLSKKTNLCNFNLFPFLS